MSASSHGTLYSCCASPPPPPNPPRFPADAGRRQRGLLTLTHVGSRHLRRSAVSGLEMHGETQPRLSADLFTHALVRRHPPLSSLPTVIRGAHSRNGASRKAAGAQQLCLCVLNPVGKVSDSVCKEVGEEFWGGTSSQCVIQHVYRSKGKSNFYIPTVM